MGRILLIAVFTAALVTSAGAVRPGTWSWLKQAQEGAGKQLFAEHCAACHAPGVAYAPTLVGVVGRRAGTVPGFPYSPALRNSGLVWTDDNLKRWLTNDSKLVPHTLMPHVSITDPVEQVYLIAYLKSLKPAH